MIQKWWILNGDFMGFHWRFIGIHWVLMGFDGIDGIELVVSWICLDLIGLTSVFLSMNGI